MADKRPREDDEEDDDEPKEKKLRIDSQPFRNPSAFNNPRLNDLKLVLVEDESDGIEVKLKEKQELFASRLLLASNSDFFARMFESGMLESRTAEFVVKVRPPMKYFVEIVRFLYTGAFELQSNELLDVWKVADQFSFIEVMKSIEAHLCNKKFLFGCEFACKVASDPIVKERLESVFERAVKEISRYESKYIYENTTVDRKCVYLAFKALLDWNSLTMESESRILSMILSWIQVQHGTVEEHLELLLLVRMPFLPRCAAFKILYPILLSFPASDTLKVLFDRFHFAQTLFSYGEMTEHPYPLLTSLVNHRRDAGDPDSYFWHRNCSRYRSHSYHLAFPDTSFMRDEASTRCEAWLTSKSRGFFGFKFVFKFNIVGHSTLDNSIVSKHLRMIDMISVTAKEYGFDTRLETKDVDFNLRVWTNEDTDFRDELFGKWHQGHDSPYCRFRIPDEFVLPADEAAIRLSIRLPDSEYLSGLISDSLSFDLED